MTDEDIREEAICRIALALNEGEGGNEDNIPQRHFNTAETIAYALSGMLTPTPRIN
ncbi:hypothetical protein 7S3_70 [uncultured Caudovirales phage]|uniref:Uncharacterized protein n=1 Tax=uncultured Caudovirales phage TaxID=2100421 RepID=A0A2H4JAB2_9CAUD|nr:hypothetical protein 7S3_70 [uncultured Caudovirales phage]